MKDYNVITIDGWKFPREWFDPACPGKCNPTIKASNLNLFTPISYLNDDLSPMYPFKKAGPVWWEDIRDRILTKDFTGVKLEQFWEMVEFLAENKNNYISFSPDYKSALCGFRDNCRERVPLRRWEITGSDTPTPIPTIPSIQGYVDKETSYNILPEGFQDFISKVEDNELSKDEIVKYLKELNK